ncbi:MAG: ABC transporter ATP-binding protein [Betaproteobacteria bacterium]|nr:ABC transporter ATP-binding protein [Betaproteobacteria bacterium]
MLSLESVDAFYGKAIALEGVSIRVDAGEITALLGRNGAGKTTALRTCMGLLDCARGKRVFQGQDVTGHKAHQMSRLGLAYVPEDRQVFPNLTVQENLEIASVAHNSGYWTQARVYELFPKLRERALSQGASLSGGEQQMLSIARAVLTNPKVLLLDEPSEGLAPLIVRDVRDAIVSINRQGVAIVLVEQKLAIPLEISNRLYVIDHGTVAWSGTTEEFRSDRANIERRMTV